MTSADEFLTQYEPKAPNNVSADEFLSKYEPKSTALDAAGAIPSGIAEGINNIPKIPANAMSFLSGLGAQIGNKVHNQISDQEFTPEQQDQNIRNAQYFKSGAITDRLGQYLQNTPTFSQIGSGIAAHALNDGNLTSEEIEAPLHENPQAFNPIDRNLPQPETQTGHIVKSLAEAIPQGKAFGLSPAQSIGMGAGSQVADAISPNNPALQAAAMYAGSKAPEIAKGAVEGAALRGKGAFGTMSPEDIATRSNQNWSDADSLFKSSNDAGAVLKPEAAQSLLAKVKESIGSTNARHADTIAELNDFEKAVDSGKLTLSRLNEFRQNFADVISDNTKSKIDGGGLNSDGYKALQAKNAIQDSLDDFTDGDFSVGDATASQNLKQGINQWAKSARFDRIAKIINDAEGDQNALKNGFSRFIKNTNNLKGFSPQEVAALKEAAMRGLGETVERGLGTFGLDLGRSKNVALPALLAENSLKGGAAAFTPHGIPLTVAGTALRQTGKYAARGKAQNVLDTISTRNIQAPRVIKTPEPYVEPPDVLSRENLKNQANKFLGTSPQLAGGANIGGQPADDQKIETKTIVDPLNYTTDIPSSDIDVTSFAKAESNNNPNAKSKTSSASGLYQFTNKTWAGMVDKYGKQTGINLSDKNDQQAQTVMVKLLAKDNIQALQKTLGRLPTKGELYMAHVLGPNGAAKLINAVPAKEAIMLFPRQVFDANRGIFFEGKRPRTAKEVYHILEKKVS